MDQFRKKGTLDAVLYQLDMKRHFSGTESRLQLNSGLGQPMS